MPTHKQVIRLSASLACSCLLLGMPSASPASAQGCFSGGCDLAWSLNKRFDDGLRSKSEAMVGPIKDAYFQIANDLFDTKLKPLIADVDQRAQARIADLNGLIGNANTAVDTVIKKASEAATAEVKNVRTQIIDEAKKDVDDIIDRIDKIIVTVDCVETKTAADVNKAIDNARNFINLNFNFVNTDKCFTSRGYWASSPSLDDDMEIYKIRQCQWERDLSGSQTVDDVLKNISRLSSLSANAKCIFTLQKSTGADYVNSDMIRYGKMYAVWKLTVK
jgi:hypothetical protein